MVGSECRLDVFPADASLWWWYGILKHRIDHLVRLRELQDETCGFQTFIPLAFHPNNSQMAHLPEPFGAMDLRVMAIRRATRLGCAGAVSPSLGLRSSPADV
jgi:hypothetical protein